MKSNNATTFVLNNSLAAISANLSNDGIIATDGLNCTLHFFDTEGNFERNERSIRPYRRLRKSPCGDYYTAITNCESARVYFLDSHLNEFCLTELQQEGALSCRCYEPDVLIDASITTIGNESFIIGAFQKSAFLFDMNGNRLQKLCKTDNCEILTDFVSLGQDFYAMSTFKNKTRTISVSDNGIVKSVLLSNDLNLRMLLPQEGTLFALFGSNYIYNKIIKIYSNGVLSLPDGSVCV